MKRSLMLLLVLFVVPQIAAADKDAKIRAAGPTSTVADHKYGNNSDRQVLDFWRAESDKPTPVVLVIHGGGWKGGQPCRRIENSLRGRHSHLLLAFVAGTCDRRNPFCGSTIARLIA
ncbi:MAG: hypothetical protein L0228_09460 [Planctomycetes bacterium]|nr:hypothetical protein [Planctomycetota bacterium]